MSKKLLKRLDSLEERLRGVHAARIELAKRLRQLGSAAEQINVELEEFELAMIYGEDGEELDTPAAKIFLRAMDENAGAGIGLSFSEDAVDRLTSKATFDEGGLGDLRSDISRTRSLLRRAHKSLSTTPGAVESDEGESEREDGSAGEGDDGD